MTQIKICGLKNSSAIEAAVTAGAAYLGFVFAESPRRVRPEKVSELTKNLPEEIKRVGVSFHRHEKRWRKLSRLLDWI